MNYDREFSKERIFVRGKSNWVSFENDARKQFLKTIPLKKKEMKRRVKDDYYYLKMGYDGLFDNDMGKLY